VVGERGQAKDAASERSLRADQKLVPVAIRIKGLMSGWNILCSKARFTTLSGAGRQAVVLCIGP